MYDQEENYDDVEACSGIIQTEAEIHAATQPATESDAAAPAGSELGDDMQPRRVSQSWVWLSKVDLPENPASTNLMEKEIHMEIYKSESDLL